MVIDFRVTKGSGQSGTTSRPDSMELNGELASNISTALALHAGRRADDSPDPILLARLELAGPPASEMGASLQRKQSAALAANRAQRAANILVAKLAATPAVAVAKDPPDSSASKRREESLGRNLSLQAESSAA